jgi:isopropylmalate/homocitrate/citramalate synthase
MKAFPNCSKSFINLIINNNRYRDIFNTLKLKNVRPFDVTLRDGLQALTKDEQSKFTTLKKKQLYNIILQNYEVKNIEIGSLVNNKVLPIFDDTEELFDYVEVNNKYYKTFEHYVLIPNFDYLIKGVRMGCQNFSFITSVSNSFQVKNTKMTLAENYLNLNNMMVYLDDHNSFKKYNIKLYVSCINECPIEGPIDNDEIIQKLVNLSKLKPDKLCLSDTCGTLNPSDFRKIITGLKNNNIDISKISLHLHVNPEREEITENLFHIALDNGINEFDVSAVNSGGCSVTMDRNKIAPNMSYDQYYKFLTSYLIKNL